RWLDHARPSELANSSIFATRPPVSSAVTAWPTSWTSVLTSATYLPTTGVFNSKRARTAYTRNCSCSSFMRFATCLRFWLPASNHLSCRRLLLSQSNLFRCLRGFLRCPLSCGNGHEGFPVFHCLMQS